MKKFFLRTAVLSSLVTTTFVLGVAANSGGEYDAAYNSYVGVNHFSNNNVVFDTIPSEAFPKDEFEVYGGVGHNVNANAVNNTLTVRGGVTVARVVIGGEIDNINDESYSGSAISNTVNIEDANIGEATGGYVWGSNGDSNNNTVNINSAQSVVAVVTGGGGERNVENNVININKGTIAQGIIGGETMYGKAVYNTVNIMPEAHINNDVLLYGGYQQNYYSDETGQQQTNYRAEDLRTGNTLNLHSKGITVKELGNFENYNFFLQSNAANGDTVLNVIGAATDISNSRVNVGFEGSAPALHNGDKITLIRNNNGLNTSSVTYGKLQQGISVNYDYVAKDGGDGKSVIVQIGDNQNSNTPINPSTPVSSSSPVGTSNPVNPVHHNNSSVGHATEQTKSLVETRTANAAFLNTGVDLLTNMGMKNALTAAEDSQGGIFTAGALENMRYETGSYANLHGYHLMLGYAKESRRDNGKLMWGPFLEGGWGNYTSHLDNGIRADGDTHYLGGGFMARQDKNSGNYVEGSLHVGRVDTDYKSDDLIGANGSNTHASYDSDSIYYAAHLGLGKIKVISAQTNRDLYAKLLYSHLNSDSAAIGGQGNGEIFDFDSTDSLRLRTGVRFNKNFNKARQGYVGLAYEYEFLGDANASVKGFETPEPSLQGSSGMLELGYIFNSDNDKPRVDVGVEGWVGQKRGVLGKVDVQWKL